MVLFYKRKQQKNRSFIRFNDKFKLKFGNHGVLAVSSGFLGYAMLSSFLIRFKKIFKIIKSITKFWFYLFSFYIISKKPLNVRMGKGKGSRKGLVSLVKSGNSIIELKHIRLNLLKYICNYISVRTSFKVKYIHSFTKSISFNGSPFFRYFKKFSYYPKIINHDANVSRIKDLNETYTITSNLKRTVLLLRYHANYYTDVVYFRNIRKRRAYHSYFRKKQRKKKYQMFYYTSQTYPSKLKKTFFLRKFLKRINFYTSYQSSKVSYLLKLKKLKKLKKLIKVLKKKRLKRFKKFKRLEKKKKDLIKKYYTYFNGEDFDLERFNFRPRKFSLKRFFLREKNFRLKNINHHLSIKKIPVRVFFFLNWARNYISYFENKFSFLKK